MKPKVINIVRAELAGDFRLHLTFDDGHEQVVDFFPFLSRSSHPDIRAWLSPSRFAEFRIEFGELVWGDHDLCFPMIDLYQNCIDRQARLEQAA